MILRNSKNGGVTTVIRPDGTKLRWGSNPELPESIDLKITNKCDNPSCVKHCHESSIPTGKHGDTGWLLNLIGQCIRGSELAIGGGNPLEHPDLNKFLLAARGRGVYANLTVNKKHVSDGYNFIEQNMNCGLINGLGISMSTAPYGWSDDVCRLYARYGSRIVFHFIAGVNTDYDIEELFRTFENPKILMLGFKTFGFGGKFLKENGDRAIQWNIDDTIKMLPSLKGKHVSFDNLAIKQLNVAEIFPKAFRDNYMGNDGSHTMYVDGVTKRYAISSTKKRIPCKNKPLKEMFEDVKHASSSMDDSEQF